MATTPKIKTAVITNFSGELTPDLIGKLNSGLQPSVSNPSGRLPIGNQFRVQGLQFTEKAYALTGSTPSYTIAPTFKAAFGIGGNDGANVVGFDVLGNIYYIQASELTGTITPDKDTISKYTALNGQDTLGYGGGVLYDGVGGSSTGTIVLGTDATGSPSYVGAYYLTGSSTSVFSLPTNGNYFQPVTGCSATLAWQASVPRPITKFLGSAYVANGRNIVQLSSNYKTYLPALDITYNSGVFNPPLPADYVIRSMQVSNDGRYLIMVATQNIDISSAQPNPFGISSVQQYVYQPADSIICMWNGSDPALTSTQFFTGVNITAIKVSSSNTILFAKDMNGVFLMDVNGNELARIQETGTPMYPPLSHSIDAVGKLFFFAMMVGSAINIYCFDASTNKLYCLASDTGHTFGATVGAVVIPTLHANNQAVGNTIKEITRLKLYYFYDDYLSGTSHYSYAIHLQNYGGVISGMYATQVEEFGRKIRPVRARVFTLPMSATTGFTLQIVDAGGNNVSGNLNYQYSAGTNPTLAQGSMTKVEFSIACKPISGFGVTIAPSGTSLPFFTEKIEIDYIDVENPPAN
jgi:hypothetical protein